MTDTKYAETLKIATYGEPGSRKTLQAGYLIDSIGHENVGIISCEGGLNTIQSKLDERYVQRVNSLDEFRKAYAWSKQTFTRHKTALLCLHRLYDLETYAWYEKRAALHARQIERLMETQP